MEGRRIRLGMRVSDVRDLDLEGKLRLAVECRLQALELSAAELADRVLVESWKRGAEGLGLVIASAGVGQNLCDPSRASQVRETMRQVLDGAQLLGAIPIFTRTMPAPEGMPQARVWDHLVPFTRELAGLCGQAGVRFAIEIDHWPCFVYNLERFERLYHAVDHPNLYLNFDPTNLYVNGSDPFLAIERWGHRFIGGHIKDGVFRTDQRSEVPLGEGEVDYPRIMAALRDRGLDLTFQFEHLKEAELVRRAARHMHEILDRTSIREMA